MSDEFPLHGDVQPDPAIEFAPELPRHEWTTIDASLIPAELRERDQWVLWRLEERDGKRTKVPYAVSGGHAAVNDPSTWAAFEDVQHVAVTYDGIGYVFADDDPFCGVDLDDCIAGDRLLHPKAQQIVDVLDSWTEVSPSGTGVKVIVRASKNGHPRCRTRAAWGGELEIYDSARFWTVTFTPLPGTRETIEDRQTQLNAIMRAAFPPPDPAPVFRPALPVDLDDEEIVERAMRAKNGEEFSALWGGDITGYPSRSEADLALCGRLSFWAGRDPERIDRMFRASGLMREKWLRDDYRERTIRAAIAATTDVYQPPSEQSWASNSVDSVDFFGESPGVADAVRSSESALKDSEPSNSATPRTHEDSGTKFDPNSVPESERPFALPIKDFIGLPREHREPMLADADGRAVVGFLSLVLLGALGGHGKTTLFVDLALHLAAGVDYPPYTVPRPVSILMIENEGPREMFAEKLEARLATFPHELKARLDVCTFDWGAFSLADDAHRRRLIDEIADKGYELVFGDPLDSLGIEGVGSPDDTRKFLALMKQSGLNRTCAWWLNTHPRKEETKEALNEIAGAWGGKPDTVFLLKMLADDRTQLRQPKLRWARRGKGPTLLFGFDPDTETFTYIGEESDVERDYLAEIRTLLADGKWRIVTEIAAPAKGGGIGADARIVKKALEEHPDVFEMRTGEGARALGRKRSAILWQLLPAEDGEQPA